MTIAQIEAYFKKMGLPEDYPLRGKKKQKILKGLHFFQTQRDWCIISGNPVPQELIDKIVTIKKDLGVE